MELGNVWVCVQLNFCPHWPMNQLNKNPRIPDTSDYDTVGVRGVMIPALFPDQESYFRPFLELEQFLLPSEALEVNVPS